jgi:hypothetical protein
MGGKPAVTALVGDFVETLASDERLMSNDQFRETRDKADRKLVKRRLHDKLCEASGGPCRLRSPVLEGVSGGRVHLKPSEWFFVRSETLDTSSTSSAFVIFNAGPSSPPLDSRSGRPEPLS